jgi:transcriptional regulator with PAS, ATPase and Fis domain
MTEKDLQSIKNRYAIIGNTPALNYALTTAVQVSNTDLTVLISGESGVGKEVFSQIIHSQSSRKHNPFIAINCGAIPEGTIDSELFGHEKGSFTSAVDARKGYFETVSGGTIFLDEIGEMPLVTQARLLRVLETGEFIRVGSSKVQKTNVRVIAATNRDLLQQVQVNRFREDLYYRLSTVPIRVPSLRDRKEDIIQLFRKFCVDFAEKYRTQPVQLNDDAKQAIMHYPWPGNVRELKNIAEQISVLSPTKNMNAQDVFHFLPNHQTQSQLPTLSRQDNHSNHEFSSERDILYKLFFDLKNDVTELKNVFFDMAKNPGMQQAGFNEQMLHQDNVIQQYGSADGANGKPMFKSIPANNPYFINPSGDQKPTDHHIDIVEESLNISEKEKELITKALKKHKKRRRDAAAELGVSERTLYRKIKEYDIED